MKRKPDVQVRNEGTLWTFLPLTRKARKWIDENVQTEPHQWLGSTLCVEHRYGPPLAEGMIAANLRVVGQ